MLFILDLKAARDYYCIKYQLLQSTSVLNDMNVDDMWRANAVIVL